MFSFGTAQLLILAVVVLLLFGKRIPETMRSLGQGLHEFKRGAQDAENDALTDAR